MTLVLGIDPGKTGALALVQDRRVLEILDMPTKVLRRGKNECDPFLVGNWIAAQQVLYGIDHCILERVSSRPGQGVASTFDFGHSFGVVRGAVAALEIPTTLVTPAEWKKKLRVPAAKNAARGRASELMPQAAGRWLRVKDDGRAEAALLAYLHFVD